MTQNTNTMTALAELVNMASQLTKAEQAVAISFIRGMATANEMIDRKEASS